MRTANQSTSVWRGDCYKVVRSTQTYSGDSTLTTDYRVQNYRDGNAGDGCCYDREGAIDAAQRDERAWSALGFVGQGEMRRMEERDREPFDPADYDGDN